MITEQPKASQGEKTATPPFKINKVGHVVFFVSDLERSIKFYTEVLPFKISDVNEQGMVFLRCGANDHHTLALVARPDAEKAPADSVRLPPPRGPGAPPAGGHPAPRFCAAPPLRDGSGRHGDAVHHPRLAEAAQHR